MAEVIVEATGALIRCAGGEGANLQWSFGITLPGREEQLLELVDSGNRLAEESPGALVTVTGELKADGKSLHLSSVAPGRLSESFRLKDWLVQRGLHPTPAQVPAALQPAVEALNAEGALLGVQGACYPNGTVIYALAFDPETVSERLEPILGSALVVAASRYAKADLRRSKEVCEAFPVQVFACGGGFGPDGQWRDHVDIREPSAAVDELVADLPEGLLDVRVWLRPRTPDRAATR